MNQFFYLWLQKGGMFRRVLKQPFTGMIGNKRWNDTGVDKINGEIIKSDNHWDDQTIIKD